MTGSILAFVILLGAPPALSDPALSDPALRVGAATGCWSPGGAPALFSWSAAPGIACRDTAGDPKTVGPGTVDRRPVEPASAAAATTRGAVPGAEQTPGGASGPGGIAFSGSAYFGVAVAF